jgi:TM2 domain-containing membrane protein YozV
MGVPLPEIRGSDQPYPPPPAAVPPPPPSASVPPPLPQVSPRFCPACGLALDPRADACPRCGARQWAGQPGKDRLVAAALALLLGGLGIHKFYLGRTALGIVYLLFCWTGIPTLIAWVEAITYLARSNEAWAAEYGGPPQRPSAVGIGCLWLLALWPAVAMAAIVMLIFLGGQVSSILSATGAAIPTPSAAQAAPAEPTTSATPVASPALTPSPAPSASPAVDMAKVNELLARLKAHPDDPATLMALGDEYYAAGQFADAAPFYDRVLALDPQNLSALQARGAVDYNLGDFPNAEKLWKQALLVDPNNQELHYDLGFLYMNLASPDWAGVKNEWNKVIAIDPTTEIAKTVQSHLDSLVAASLLP